MLFPISIDIFPKPIKIPKFVALVFEVQSAIKMENIKIISDIQLQDLVDNLYYALLDNCSDNPNKIREEGEKNG